MKKLISIAAVAAATVGAHALELGLVVDAGNKDVRRFDTFTGTYFGSFGGGFLVDPKSVAITSDGIAHVLDVVSSQGVVRRFRYNTGDYLGGVVLSNFSFTGQPQLTVGSDGSYLATGGASSCVGRWTTTGAQIGFACQTSGGGECGLAESGGNLYTIGNSPVQLNQIALSAIVGNAVRYPTQTPVSNVNAGRQMQIRNNRIWWINSGNDSVTSTNLNGTSAIAFPITTQLDVPQALAFDHTTTAYIGGFEVGSTTVGKIIRLDTLTNVVVGSFGQNFLKAPVSMAILTAPEPGSCAIIALGIAALAARRRKA